MSIAFPFHYFSTDRRTSKVDVRLGNQPILNALLHSIACYKFLRFYIIHIYRSPQPSFFVVKYHYTREQKEASVYKFQNSVDCKEGTELGISEYYVCSIYNTALKTINRVLNMSI